MMTMMITSLVGWWLEQGVPGQLLLSLAQEQLDRVSSGEPNFQQAKALRDS